VVCAVGDLCLVLFVYMRCCEIKQYSVGISGCIRNGLGTTQHFRESSTKQYAVFSRGGGVYTAYTKQHAVYSGVDNKWYWCIVSKNY